MCLWERKKITKYKSLVLFSTSVTTYVTQSITSSAAFCTQVGSVSFPFYSMLGYIHSQSFQPQVFLYPFFPPLCWRPYPSPLLTICTTLLPTYSSSINTTCLNHLSLAFYIFDAFNVHLTDSYRSWSFRVTNYCRFHADNNWLSHLIFW